MAVNSAGHQQLTVSSTGVGVTMPTANGKPGHATLYFGGEVRWRADGTDPTAAIGILQQAGSYLQLQEPDEHYFGFLTRLRFIRTGGTDVLVDIEFFS